MNTRKLFSLTALSLVLAAGVQAQMAPSAPLAPAVASGAHAAAGGHLAVGVVRAVDAKARTLTIAHQAIAGMGMPAMTMPFRLDDGVSAPAVKAGDTVAFILTSTSQGAVISSVQSVVGAAGGDKSSGQGMSGMMQGMQMDQCHEMMTKK